MGRWARGNNFEYKFWFACQDTADILTFGEEVTDVLNVNICYDDLAKIEEKVKILKEEFKALFGLEYAEFMDKIEKKGYLSSSNDEETQTDSWNGMSKKASKINLGEEVIKALKENRDDLYLECEC